MAKKKVSEVKIYDVPEEIVALFTEVEAMETLRDAYVKRPLGFKKAKKCSIAKEVASRKAWRMFAELYPDASSNGLIYTHRDQKVTEAKS
jgi:hypothetical protein